MKKTTAVFSAILIAVLCIFTVRFWDRQKTYSADIFALDTYISLQITTESDGDIILEECKNRIRTLEQLLSHTIDNSDITKINTHAGDGSFVSVSPETLEIIQLSKKFYTDSGGALDITVAPLVNLWNVTSDNPRVPDNADIQTAMTLTDINSIIIDTSAQAVRLEKPNQAITLGAVAKGYITDELIKLLKNHAVQSAILNLGGNTATIGTRPDGTPWRIGVQNPDNTEKILGTLSVSDKCVITSGDYERYFEYNGERYHHIINPQTGYPAKSNLRSVTIISGNSTVADSLSTSCFILGKDKSKALLEKYNCSAIFCDSDMNISIVGNIDFEQNQSTKTIRNFN